MTWQEKIDKLDEIAEKKAASVAFTQYLNANGLPSYRVDGLDVLFDWQVNDPVGDVYSIEDPRTALSGDGGT